MFDNNSEEQQQYAITVATVRQLQHKRIVRDAEQEFETETEFEPENVLRNQCVATRQIPALMFL